MIFTWKYIEGKSVTPIIIKNNHRSLPNATTFHLQLAPAFAASSFFMPHTQKKIN